MNEKHPRDRSRGPRPGSSGRGPSPRIAAWIAASIAASIGWAAACASPPATEDAPPAAPTVTLHEAIVRGDVAAIEDRVAAGEDLESFQGGELPLHLAAREGSIEVVQALLRLGARPDSRGPSGRTALHIAAAEGREAVGRALIAAGARVDARDAVGDEPLHLSAVKAVDALLISAGASLESVGAEEASALDVLRRRGERATRELTRALETADYEAVRACLARGASARERDAEGLTPLERLLFARGRVLLRLADARGEQLRELSAAQIAGREPIELGSGRVAGITWEPGEHADAGLETLRALLLAGADAHQPIDATGLWLLFPGIPGDMSEFESRGVVRLGPAQFARAIGQADAADVLNRAAGR